MKVSDKFLTIRILSVPRKLVFYFLRNLNFEIPKNTY